MATRIYLPSSGTAPLGSLAVDTNWELSGSLVRLPCDTAKSNTPLTQKSGQWSSATTQQWVWTQFQSPPMTAGYSWTTSDTVSMVIKVAESIAQGDSHLAYVVRVVSGDGATIRGVIGLYHATSTEYPTSLATIATRIHNARTAGATNFSSIIGDRIIIEIGHHGVTPDVAAIVYHNYGDPSAVQDQILAAGETTDYCPWVELSRTVSFHFALTVAGPNQLQSSGSVSLTQKRNLPANNTQQTQSSDKVVLTAYGPHYALTTNNAQQLQSSGNVIILYHASLAVQNTNQLQVAGIIGLTQHQILFVNDCVQIQITDNATLIQNYKSLVNNSQHLQTSYNAVLIQNYILAIDNPEQLQSSGNVVLIYYPPPSQLVILDTEQLQVTDNVTLIQHQILFANDSAQTQVANNITLVQNYKLLTNNSQHSQESNNIILIQNYVLAIDNIIQLQTSENIVLIQHYMLAIDGSVQLQTVDNIILTAHTPVFTLTVQDSYLLQGTDGATVTQHHILIVNSTEQHHFSNNLELISHQVGSLTVQNSNQTQVSDNISLTQYQILLVNDSLQIQVIDNIILAQNYELSVDDSQQLQTTDNIELAQHYILAINNIEQTHFADNLELISHQIGSLTVYNSAHLQTSDNIILTAYAPTFNLTIQNAEQLQNSDNVILVFYAPPTSAVAQNTSQLQVVDNIILSPHNIYSLTIQDSTQLQTSFPLWWLAGGIDSSNVAGAYQPERATSYLTSLININNPGTNDAIDDGGDTSPDWNNVDGWVGDAGSLLNYLRSTIIPSSNQLWSLLIKYNTGGFLWVGSANTVGGYNAYGIYVNNEVGYISFMNGGGVNYWGTHIIGFSGINIYSNGIQQVPIIPPGSDIPVLPVNIFGANNDGVMTGTMGSIQAEVWYSTVLTPIQVLAVTNAMNNLGNIVLSPHNIYSLEIQDSTQIQTSNNAMLLFYPRYTTKLSLETLNYSYQGQPWVHVAARPCISFNGLDWSYNGQPFWGYQDLRGGFPCSNAHLQTAEKVGLTQHHILIVNNSNQLQINGMRYQWWLAGEINPANVDAVYQPRGAENYADSLVNRANPGTNDAFDDGHAPGWNITDGWIGVRSESYLCSNIIPNANQVGSVLIKFTNFLGINDIFGSENNTSGTRFGIAITAELVYKNGGTYGNYNTISYGVLGWAGNKAYKNGVQETGTITAGDSSPGIPVSPLGYNYRGEYRAESTVRVQAEVWYNTVLTPSQMLSITEAMNNLERLVPLVLSPDYSFTLTVDDATQAQTSTKIILTYYITSEHRYRKLYIGAEDRSYTIEHENRTLYNKR